MENNTKQKAININKPMYYLFLLAGIYFLVTNNFSQAVSFFGIGLIFDPFNVNQPFGQRPFYQKAWLIVHLLITLTLFIMELSGFSAI